MNFSSSDIQEYGRRRWRRVQYLADQFWIRWRRDYLKSADVRRKWKKPRRNLQVGDVVLLRDRSVRDHWPMGLISQVFPDRNGFVRRVELRKRNLRSLGPSREIVERAVSDLVLLVPSQT